MSSRLSLDELRAVLKDLGEYTDEADLQTHFRDMDPDGNGIFFIYLMMIFTMFEARFLLICPVGHFTPQNAGNEVQSNKKQKIRLRVCFCPVFKAISTPMR